MKAARGGLLDLLRRPILRRTVLMGLCYLLFMMSEYFFLNWNNQLTTNAGFTDRDGIFITRLTSLGGLPAGWSWGCSAHACRYAALPPWSCWRWGLR